MESYSSLDLRWLSTWMRRCRPTLFSLLLPRRFQLPLPSLTVSVAAAQVGPCLSFVAMPTQYPPLFAAGLSLLLTRMRHLYGR